MRHILFYTHAMSEGGAERVLALLASGFARRGYKVTLAVDRRSADQTAYLSEGVRVLELGRQHLQGGRALARLIKQDPPEVSLSALGLSNFKHVAACASVGRLSRCITSYHGSFWAEPRPLAFLSNLLLPVSTRLSARTIFVSDSLREEYVKLGASPSRSIRIYNPVDLRLAIPVTSGDELRRRSPVVLCVSRLVGVKNVRGVIRAFASLQRPDARLVILGDGPERPQIECEIARYGLADRVRLAGYVSEPWDHYREASCLVSNSRSEAFGNSIIEALAHGLPVVATDCGGPREILDNGRFGRLVAINDDHALAAGIDAALSDPGDPLPRISRAQSFDLSRVVDLYENLFREVLSKAE